MQSKVRLAHRVGGVGDDAEGVGRAGQVVRPRRVAKIVGGHQDLAVGEVALDCTGHTARVSPQASASWLVGGARCCVW